MFSDNPAIREDFFPWIRLDMQSIAGVPYAEDPGVHEKLSLRNYLDKTNPVLFFAEAQNEHVFPSKKTWEIVAKHRAWEIRTNNYIFLFREKSMSITLTCKDATYQQRKAEFASILSSLKFDKKALEVSESPKAKK